MNTGLNPKEADGFCVAICKLMYPHHAFSLSRRIKQLFKVHIDPSELESTLVQLKDRALLHHRYGMHQGGAWKDLDCYEVLSLVAFAHLHHHKLAIRNTVYGIVGWLKGFEEER